MSTQNVPLYVASEGGHPLPGGLTHAVCPQNASSPTCTDRSRLPTVYFSLPAVVGGQCCGYEELYISPSPPYSQVTLHVNDLALEYQQCPVLHGDGSSVGVVKLATNDGPLFFDPSRSVVFLGIADPTMQISVSGYSVSAKIVCHPQGACENLYSTDYSITSYAVPPCTRNKTTGASSCPDGYCVSRVFNPVSGIKADQYDGDPSKRPHITCPCAPGRFPSCSQRCGANSTCVVSKQAERGTVEDGTCSGCPNVACSVFESV
jgi:hypothetical protein